MATVNLRDLVALLQSSFANRDAARNAADASEALSCHVVAQRAPEAADLGWFFLVAGKERAAETAEAMAGALNADWAQVSRAQAHEAPNVACFIIPSPRPGASAIRWPAELALGMAEARDGTLHTEKASPSLSAAATSVVPRAQASTEFQLLLRETAQRLEPGVEAAHETEVPPPGRHGSARGRRRPRGLTPRGRGPGGVWPRRTAVLWPRQPHGAGRPRPRSPGYPARG